MTNCKNCKKPLDIAPNDGLQHNVCHDQVMDRVNNKMCYKCGKEPFLPGQGWACKGCQGTGHDAFEGISGP